MLRSLVLLTLLSTGTTVFAALDGYYSSAREIEMIVTTKATEVREMLGTAYPIEKIVARHGGYFVSAKNNKGQLCTVSLTILESPGATPFGAPLLDLKSEGTVCE